MTGPPPGTPAGATGPQPQLAVAAAFRVGIRRGEDPVSALTSGPTRTTRASRWCASYCGVCGHNFRVDDPVLVTVGDDGTIVDVRHDGASWCGTTAVEHRGDPAVVSAFYAGLDAVDPPRRRHTVRLLPGHPLLTVRGTASVRDRRAKCFVCSQTLRPFEFVIICVCSPAERRCQLTAHRDPAHNLLCYDEFTQGQELRQCPMDYRSLR